MATRTVTVNDMLVGHVGLDVECLDRVYLNLCVPNLQVPGQVVLFLRRLGFPIPSPAVIEKIGARFRANVGRFCAANGVPVVRFAKGDGKIEVMRPYVEHQAATGRSGVAAVGVAQEWQKVFSCTTRDSGTGGAPTFSWGKADRRVTPERPVAERRRARRRTRRGTSGRLRRPVGRPGPRRVSPTGRGGPAGS